VSRTDTDAARKTEGRKLLNEWFVLTGTKKTAFAKKCRVSQPAVSQWSSGTSRPDDDLRKVISRLTGGHVPVGSWLTARERKAEAQAASLKRAG
jgi:DNA-binding transcriptional regulator YdaS (Cro superfamily)